MNPNSLPKQFLDRAQIEELLAMRETQQALKSRLALMENSIEKAEASIVSQIEAGADLSKCGYEVAIKEVSRRYPAWKEHFIGKLGKEAADVVLNETVPMIYRKLVIE